MRIKVRKLLATESMAFLRKLSAKLKSSLEMRNPI